MNTFLTKREGFAGSIQVWLIGYRLPSLHRPAPCFVQRPNQFQRPFCKSVGDRSFIVFWLVANEDMQMIERFVQVMQASRQLLKCRFQRHVYLLTSSL
jgi:hypothetical protein